MEPINNDDLENVTGGGMLGQLAGQFLGSLGNSLGSSLGGSLGQGLSQLIGKLFGGGGQQQAAGPQGPQGQGQGDPQAQMQA